MEGRILAFILVCNLCMQCCEGDAVRNVTIAVKSLAHFPCNVEEIPTTIWLFTRRNEGANSESISQGDIVYPRFEDKFEIEIPPNNSTSRELNLKFNVTEEDEGLYLCQEEGTNKAQFNLVVEIPPVLQLKRDNTVISTDIDVVSSKEVTIECVAEGGKPPVKLSWKVNGQKKTGSFIEDSPPSSQRRVTSVIRYIPTVEDNTLSCVKSGQQVIPEQEVSVAVNVQYQPNCVMGITNTTNAFVITCSCKANPEVQRYEIYVNGSLFSQEMKTTLPSEKSATVFCNATNDVGSFATQPESLKPFHEEVPLQLSGSALVIGLCVAGVTVALLISIVIFVFCKYRKKKKVAEDLSMNAATAGMIMKPLPDEPDSEQGNKKQLEDSDKGAEQKPDKEEGSKKPNQEKDGDGPVPPSNEEEPNQEEKTLIDNADEEQKSEKEEGSKEPHKQKDGLDLNQTAAVMAMKPLPEDNDSEQEKENLMSNAE